jgi:hypothetical protein
MIYSDNNPVIVAPGFDLIATLKNASDVQNKTGKDVMLAWSSKPSPLDTITIIDFFFNRIFKE